MAQLWLRNPDNFDSNFRVVGEKFLAKKLCNLEDSWCIWHDPQIASSNNKPDFLLLHPIEGIVLIEAKDWLPETIKKVNTEDVEKSTGVNPDIVKAEKNPYTQAAESFYVIKELLQKQNLLCDINNLRIPYGFGVFFYNIERQTLIDKGWEQFFGTEIRDYQNIVCMEEIESLTSSNDIQDRLKLFQPKFRNKPQLTQDELEAFCDTIGLPQRHLDLNKVICQKNNEPVKDRPRPKKHRSYSIGLDFGTTNSIVSYLENEQPIAFRYGASAECPNYIPSFIAYEQDDILIGREARSIVNNDNTKTFGNFKMFLPLSQDEATQKFTEKYIPTKLTADYLRKLLLSQDNGCSFKTQKGELNGIVVSVPEIWLRDPSNRGRENLRKIIGEDLGLKKELIQLVSEPVAAAAYYAWKIHQEEPNFTGNVLVCDMGGGTFDISLCRVYLDNTIKVLYYDGKGEKGLESAGVAFDRNCVRKAMAKKGEDVEEKGKKFQRLLKEFESAKIDRHNTFTRDIKQYYQKTTEIADRSIYSFSDGDYSLTSQEVVDVFEPIKVGIKETIEKLCHYIESEKNIKINRIFFVGGFCQFYPVQEAILNTLKEFYNTNFEIEKGFDFTECTNAISYGACLIANGLSKPVEEYPHSIGIWTENFDDIEGMQKKFIPIIKGGESVEELTSPQFIERIFESFSSKPSVNLGLQLNSQGEVKQKQIIRFSNLTAKLFTTAKMENWYES
jgi:molecular chaperone DnaK